MMLSVLFVMIVVFVSCRRSFATTASATLSSTSTPAAFVAGSNNVKADVAAAAAAAAGMIRRRGLLLRPTATSPHTPANCCCLKRRRLSSLSPASPLHDDTTPTTSISSESQHQSVANDNDNNNIGNEFELIVKAEYWIDKQNSSDLRINSTSRSATTTSNITICDFLMDKDPTRFPSKSQVKKAIRYGWIVVGKSELESEPESEPEHTLDSAQVSTSSTNAKSKPTLTKSTTTTTPTTSNYFLQLSRSSNYHKYCDRIRLKDHPSIISMKSSSSSSSSSSWIIPTSTNMPMIMERSSLDEYDGSDDAVKEGSSSGVVVVLVLDRCCNDRHNRYLADDGASSSCCCYPTSVTKYLFPPSSSSSSTIRIVYEDEDLAVVYKPHDMTTIDPTYNSNNRNVEEPDLMSCLGFILTPPRPPPPPQPHRHQHKNDPSPINDNNNEWIPPVPRPVHRLDRGTSGLVIVAKTDEAMKDLSKQFANRMVKKTYAAVVIGQPNSKDIFTSKETSSSLSSSSDAKDDWNMIDYPIDGKDSQTEWKILLDCHENKSMDEISGPYSPYTLLEVRPHQGRTHQIRRHLTYCLGSPIVGDKKYGRKVNVVRRPKNDGEEEYDGRMYLCCYELEFYHPNRKNARMKNGTDDVSSKSSERSFGVVEHDPAQGVLKIQIPIPEEFFRNVRQDVRVKE